MEVTSRADGGVRPSVVYAVRNSDSNASALNRNCRLAPASEITCFVFAAWSKVLPNFLEGSTEALG